MIYREFVLPGVSLQQASVVFLSAWEYLRNEEWKRSGQEIQCCVTESNGFGVCFEIGVLPDPMLVVGVCQLANALTVAIGLIDQARSALANDVEEVFENFPSKVDFRPRSRPLPLWMMVLDAPNAKSYWHGGDADQGAPAVAPSAQAGAVVASGMTDAESKLDVLVHRADRGKQSWWNDLIQWWVEYHKMYTYEAVASRVSFSVQRVKQMLPPKNELRDIDGARR